MTTEAFLVELVGILGFLTNVWANVLLARKTESGWIIRLGANALWLVYGFAVFSLANILSSGVFAVINVYGWRRWRRERLAGPPPCSECVARAWAEHNAAPVAVRFDDRLVRDTLPELFASRPAARSVVGEIDVPLRETEPRE